MYMVEKLDAGDMLAKVEVDIEEQIMSVRSTIS